MTIYRLVNRILSMDGDRRCDILVRDDGRIFRFVESARQIDHDDKFEYWVPVYESGLYPDGASAEHDMALIFPWISRKRSD